MTITFPASPTLGDLHTSGLTTWEYTAHGWRLHAGTSTGGGTGGGGTGPAGASAYEIAVANGFSGSQSAWLASLHGANGTNGADGADGQGIQLKGSLSSSTLLPTSGNTAGDTYLITGHLWVWNGSAWVDQGSIQGPAGTNGTNGTNGTPGAVWRSGSGVPSNGTGLDGDFYLRTNGDVYARSSGAYSVVANILGPAGAAGSPGAAATVAVGTVTSGSTPSVTNAGTSTAAVLNFVLAKGDPGDTGPPGADGAGALGGMVDVVSQYGADPTGVADSTSAFNSAKNSGKSVIWVPAGTYKVSSLIWDKEISLWGPSSKLVTIKPTGSGIAFVWRPTTTSTNTAWIEGITLDGVNNTQASTLCGMLVQRKMIADDVVIKNFNGTGARYAPYDASTTTGAGGTIGNAVFFSLWTNCKFTDNGVDGLDVRMGANDNGHLGCQFLRNGGVGYHHRTDGGATYGNWVSGGQASYNTSYGYHWESGTDVKAWALYSEYNGSPTNTNTDGYTNTPFDIYVADNISRSDIDCGVLLNADAAHVRAPASGLNDSCSVRAGGDRVFGSTKYHTPHEVTAPAACTATTVAGVVDWLNNQLVVRLKTGSTFS